MKKSQRAIVGMLAGLTIFAMSTQAEEFSPYWHDGKAELDGYNLQVSRYGQTRTGRAVMIYVTEPFSASKHVKVDDHRKNPKDVIDVLKLNLVRDFQTGIYDYNTMTSVFVRSDTFEPSKISFSSAEWCGHVYGEVVFDGKKVNGRYHSYFEDESAGIALDRPANGISEDNLFILLRGLRGDFLAAGETKTVPMLGGLFASRLAHEKLKWDDVTITRAADTEDVTVPAGAFKTIVYEVKASGGRVGQFYIESDYPHRIVRWRFLPDVVGELTGSARREYWNLNGNGDESYLNELGLSASK